MNAVISKTEVNLSIGLKLNLSFRLSFGLKPEFKTLVLAET